MINYSVVLARAVSGPFTFHELQLLEDLEWKSDTSVDIIMRTYIIANFHSSHLAYDPMH